MDINFTSAFRDQNQPGEWKEIYGILSRGQPGVALDSHKGHSSDDIREVQVRMHSMVKANYAKDGITFQTLEEARNSVCDKTVANIKALQRPAVDAMYNPMTGIGTLSDPASFTSANIPLQIGPFESTALYSSGGLPTIIADKKSKGILSNGMTFRTVNEKFWDDEKINHLSGEVYKTNLEKEMGEALRDATIYGGSALYPVFKNESIITFDEDFDNLIAQGVVTKGCVERWAHADRWNMVFVPSFNISAKDYLFAELYYIPLSGISINTSRSAILRPKQLPYWGAIRQLGWGTSDYEGYMRMVYAYYMMTMAIPVMAQQMSLLLYQMPMDAMISQLGVDNVRRLMDINEEKMREWSILNPKAVNMVGEVVTVNRTFSGFEHFTDAMITALCAESEMPRPLLFHTPTKGFADNTQESLLKESEMMRQRQKDVEPQLHQITKIMVAHAYGADSEEYKHVDELFISFDKPVVATDKDKAEIGARYSATVNSLRQAGVPPHDALVVAKQFFPSATIPAEILESVKKAYEREIANEDKALDIQEQSAKSQEEGQARNGKPPMSGSGTKTGKSPQLHQK
jgi:hypothetical protein